MSHFVLIKLLSVIALFIIAVLAGLYPFIKKIRSGKSHEFQSGQAFSAGIFLGVGLIHMLSSASSEFYKLHVVYPLAALLAGTTFLILLLLEHLGKELYSKHADSHPGFAILAFVMLSIHSLLAGVALGIGYSWSVFLVLLVAIVAHKWAASFALAVQINKTSMSAKYGFLMFMIFAVMTPVGILLGTDVGAAKHSMLEPIFTSLAAGTFLYLGTLHGLSRSFMVNKCCNLKQFSFVVLGFALMAIVAIWS